MPVPFTRFGEVFGVKLTIPEISKGYGISKHTVRNRVENGKKDAALIRPVTGPGAWRGLKTRPITRWGDYFGKKMNANELAALRPGLKRKTVLERIRKGWKDADLIKPCMTKDEQIALLNSRRGRRGPRKEPVILPPSPEVIQDFHLPIGVECLVSEAGRG